MSNLFEPYKSIGRICDDKPFAVRFGSDLEKDGRIYCCVENSYQAYGFLGNNLGFRLKHVGPQLGHEITSIAVLDHVASEPDFDDVYCGLRDGTIVALRQRKCVAVLKDGHFKAVLDLTFIGPKVLLSFGIDNRCCIWDLESKELDHLFSFESDLEYSCSAHLETYIDKIFIGSQTGHIDLYNFRAGKRLHRFGPFTSVEEVSFVRDASQSETNVGVSCLQPVPGVLDLMAIGLSDGRIIIHNMRSDESLITFNHYPGPIVDVAFRTDGNPILLSGNSTGEIAIWNLETQKLVGTLPHAHNEGVVSLTFIPQDNRMISSGEDNTLKLWECETLERVVFLGSLEGHSKPPNKVRFYGPSGMWCLSSGRDKQLRYTSMSHSFSQQLSHKVAKQAKQQKTSIHSMMMPAVTNFETCYLREGDWDNVLSCHLGSPTLYSWNIKNLAIGKGRFTTNFTENVQCICLTTCGNWGLAGRTNGVIERWIMQSKRSAGTFEDEKISKAHNSVVTGLAVDHVNKNLFSGDFEGLIKVWDFKTKKLLQVIETGSPITGFVKSKNSNLLAIACGDFSVKLFDMHTCKVIRIFRGHKHNINDMTFTSDTRFLITCGNDNFIIVWDIISSDKVDWLRVPSVPTSIDCHPDDLYFATTHAGEIGICLWVNKLTFESAAFKYVKEPVNVNLPMSGEISISNEVMDDIILSKEQFPKKLEEFENTETISFPDDIIEKTKKQKGQMITLSGESKSKWYSIAVLDKLRQKSRQNQKPKDIRAPFLLTTAPDKNLQPHFVNSEESKADSPIIEPQKNPTGDFFDLSSDEEKPHVEAKTMELPPSSRFIQLIIQDRKSENHYQQTRNFITSQSSNVIELSIRLLSSLDEGREFKEFLHFVLELSSKNHDFDLVQGMLNLFLQAHNEVIINMDDPVLFDLLKHLYTVQNENHQRFESLMNETSFLVKLLSHLQ